MTMADGNKDDDTNNNLDLDNSNNDDVDKDEGYSAADETRSNVFLSL